MNVEQGKTYQSRNFPHITRKVVRVKGEVVSYQILDSTKPDELFPKMAEAVLSEFRKCSTHEVIP